MIQIAIQLFSIFLCGFKLVYVPYRRTLPRLCRNLQYYTAVLFTIIANTRHKSMLIFLWINLMRLLIKLARR